MSSHNVRAAPSHGIKSILPFILALLAAVLTTLSYGVSMGADATPSITLIVVFFWVSRRPALLPPLAILAIGLWHDALIGAPIGLTPMLLLAVRAAIVEQNIIIFSQSFLLGWIGFAALCSLITLLEWLVVSWVQGAFMAGSPFVVQAVLGIVVYPLVAGLCGWLDYVVFGIRKG